MEHQLSFAKFSKDLLVQQTTTEQLHPTGLYAVMPFYIVTEASSDNRLGCGMKV
jgi:hypothetical protein